MVGIVFPLATNIKSFQKWGDNDISKRLKQSLILYDRVIVETGTYYLIVTDNSVFPVFEPWEKNSKESITEKMAKLEDDGEEKYLTVINGITRLEKYKERCEKKNSYIADFRMTEVISEIESGNYGKIDFLEYLDINREKTHIEETQKNTQKDLSDREFAEIVTKIHGRIPAFVFLNNLNDSLLISHAVDMPVGVDSIYASLLRLKTKCKIGLQFSVLKRLAKIGIPDFGELSLEKILELRKDKALTSFRDRISTLSTRLQSESNLNIESLFTEDFLEQVMELAPSKKRIALNAFVGSLSTLIDTLSNVPLVGSVTTASEICKQVKGYRKFSSNWVSFILKAYELKHED